MKAYVKSPTGNLTTATVGGVSRLGDQLYYTTAAHVSQSVIPCPRDSLPDEDEEIEIDDDSDSDDGSADKGLEPKRRYIFY
jgi:hypothetical protein